MRKGGEPCVQRYYADIKFHTAIRGEHHRGGYISLVQNRETVIEKTISECEMEEKTIKLKLSQADTLQLDDHTATEIQLRIRLTDGTALASKIFTVSTERILRDGVI